MIRKYINTQHSTKNQLN